MNKERTTRRQRILNILSNLPARGFNWISGGAMLAMMLVLVANILLRAVANQPILGTIELIQYLMAFVVFFAIAYTQVYRRHIRVDVLSTRFPKKLAAVFDVIATLLGLVLFGLVSWQSAIYGMQLLDSGIISMAFGFREGWFYFVVTFGSVLFCLVLLAHLIESLRKVRK